MMHYAELFAGAGGMSLGLEAGGFTPFAHAEIEPHARAVLRHHWPDVRLDGDVTQINGADYRGVMLLSGGSPCQDLSVAGKRAGIIDGARSSLFFEQVRIWQESDAPYLLWENVYGALLSNKGEDFALVLGALVGADVAVPLVNGTPKWLRSGRAVGPAGVAAWRVLDLQHFGPPQRRVRLFVLCARPGGVDPAEVLAFGEGVCGHPAPRDAARESVAGGAARGVGGRSGVISFDTDTQRIGNVTHTRRLTAEDARPCVIAFDTTQHGSGGDVAPTRRAMNHDLSHQNGGGQVGVVITWDNELNASESVQGPLMARGKSGSDRNGVLAVEPRSSLRDNTTGGAPSDLVMVNASIGKNGDAVPHVVAFALRGREHGAPLEISGEATSALRGAAGGSSRDMVIAYPPTQDPISGSVSPAIGGTTAGMAVVCTTGDVTHALTHEGADASEDGTGRGTPIVVGVDIAPTLEARDYKGPASYFNGAVSAMVYPDARPRRLMPVECERLMGWPPGWTATGTRDDGDTYALSDTARYRLCGNGVGSPCAEWIAKRLLHAIADAAQARERGA